MNEEFAREFQLAEEDGDWYIDAPVFGRHAALQKLVTELLKSRAHLASDAQRIERLEEALYALFCATLNEMTVRNLPWEWTPQSAMGVTAELLGVAHAPVKEK